ncbi:hypothetical protein BT96DRAFT_372532 [Gymnopus androsaceus JB14]|uniref:F-box domain-containing protein n=1 Tax=Gymnopus androsaceus JB14 TaxID=1447944 RepID=A0A6A4INN7_9AGAR|nr:hypothetical protein BT96DRAFT_372532 [Gymnopus androsaceus JB14]
MDLLTEDFARILHVPPIHKISQDLLGYIFEICCKATRGLKREQESQYVQHIDPLVLSQICSRWRSIILSMPLLWIYVPVRLRGYRAPRLSAIVQLRAARSRNLPLAISFRAGDKGAVEHPCQLMP